METEYDEDGNITIRVKAEWILTHTHPSHKDRACQQCYPEGFWGKDRHDYLVIDGFACPLHRALKALDEK